MSKRYAVEVYRIHPQEGIGWHLLPEDNSDRPREWDCPSAAGEFALKWNSELDRIPREYRVVELVRL